MKYNEMIKTENTDQCYESWTSYREKLTDYIIESVEHEMIRLRLCSDRTLHLTSEYNIEAAIVSEGRRPVLAIWGAGGCNDIDIVRLTKYFRLVLIDRDTDKAIRAIKRFGLDESECVCVDLKFWDITEEEYLMLEALLMDNADTASLVSYMEELGSRQGSPDYAALPHFDYSVVVGLASQLNVRLSVLTDLYGRYDELNTVIAMLDTLAVGRMMEACTVMTERLIILGYEVSNIAGMELYRIEDRLRLLNEETDDMFLPENMTDISGNDALEQWIAENVIKGAERCIMHRRADIWDFSYDKKYLMLFLTFDNIEKREKT